MNPFLYPALIVLCLCGILTAASTTGPIWGGLLIAPIWITAGWMLAAIAMASLTGTGGRGAAAITSALVALVAYSAWKIRRRSGVSKARVATGSTR